MTSRGYPSSRKENEAAEMAAPDATADAVAADAAELMLLLLALMEGTGFFTRICLYCLSSKWGHSRLASFCMTVIIRNDVPDYRSMKRPR